jgi:predicted nucleic acid-binding protein
MIFVDTWAWIALADETDQYHAAATKQHRKLLKNRRRYVTSDYVLTEFINYLYTAAPARQAESIIESLLARIDSGAVQLVHVTPDLFRRAWQMRRKYADKPDISFIDFTSFVVMKELGITEVFTGDRHFKEVNLGFRLYP